GRVLGRAAVDARANFFDLGGDSLAMVRVQAGLAEQLRRDVAVVDLFRYPNVRALAAQLDGTENTTGNRRLRQAAQRGAARRHRAQARLARRPADEETDS
ncbi:MAG TPA: phosphopantetheine-binding protein, partial [Pseudonocardiaceae bacterium]|nr:phosphopantetheine-binding protein [Pseudonocardiaceae bacterium]